jgi:hypothetical protein
MAVPVIITNRGSDFTNWENDWTIGGSPITEYKYKSIQKWWPIDIFNGTITLNNPEEIILDYSGRFTIRLSVIYAYAKEVKKLFDSIDIKEDVEKQESKPSSKEVMEQPVEQPVGQYFILEETKVEEPTEDKEKEEVKNILSQISEEARNKKSFSSGTDKNGVKLMVGIGITAMTIGILLSIKWFSSLKELN